MTTENHCKALKAIIERFLPVGQSFPFNETHEFIVQIASALLEDPDGAEYRYRTGPFVNDAPSYFGWQNEGGAPEYVRETLVQIDEACVERFHKQFADLDSATQDLLLKELDEQVFFRNAGADSARFIRLISEACVAASLRSRYFFNGVRSPARPAGLQRHSSARMFVR